MWVKASLVCLGVRRGFTVGGCGLISTISQVSVLSINFGCLLAIQEASCWLCALEFTCRP